VLLKAAWGGNARLCVAQFWQISGKDPWVVVYGTNTGAIVPAVPDHK
jgi:hypothetical protein